MLNWVSSFSTLSCLIYLFYQTSHAKPKIGLMILVIVETENDSDVKK